MVPTSDFYNRHARDRGLPDREITAGRFEDLPSHVPGDSAVLVLAGRPGRQPGKSNDGPEIGRRRTRPTAAAMTIAFPDHPRPLPRLDVTAADKAAMTAVLTHR